MNGNVNGTDRADGNNDTIMSFWPHLWTCQTDKNVEESCRKVLLKRNGGRHAEDDNGSGNDTDGVDGNNSTILFWLLRCLL